MARKTNKTDHLLNLLAGGSGQEETQQEAGKAADSKEVLEENKAGDPKQEGDMAQAAEKADAHREAAGGQDAAPGVASAYESGAVGKNVHVVRAVGSEDPIAELIREELETDLNEAIEKAGVKEEAVMEKDTVQDEAMPMETEMDVSAQIAAEGAEAAEEAVMSAETSAEGPEAIEEIPVPAEVLAEKPEAAVSVPGEAVTETIAEEASGGTDVPVQEEAAGSIAEEEAREQEVLDEVRGGTIEEQQGGLLTEGTGQEESEGDDNMQGYVFHNMMETIVRDKVPEYIEQFGVCTCKHCRADVIALALSKLPPKYVVVHESAISPLRSFYEDHYAGQIVVEITKACIAVSSHPHHSR